MNKKIIYSLCMAALFITGCDYNEDNFPGFDDTPVTDVIYYEGEFTGKYPTEGYFSVVQGDEETGKTAIETALSTMLKGTYPYCDAGSSAKVTVKVADVLPSQEKEPAYKEKYSLKADDYDSMGTEKGQPGKYDNFDKNMDVNAYLTAFCATKYADKAEGFICKITYKYYAGTTTDESKYYKKGASSWTEESMIPFEADKMYTLIAEDYATMGTAEGEPGAKNEFANAEEAAKCLAIFLKNKYAYVAKDGLTVKVTYKVAGTVTSEFYRYNGSVWAIYNPQQSVVVSITDRITVMKFDGKSWKLTNLISHIAKQELVKADYTSLYEWTKANKDKGFLSTQGKDEEYYTGSSSSYGNINNAYATWSKYYNVNGYLNDLDNDEIQAVMDKQLAEGIATALLPVLISNPDPDTSYTIVYKVYGGRGSGNYAMSFYYNATDNTFTWDEMNPITQ